MSSVSKSTSVEISRFCSLIVMLKQDAALVHARLVDLSREFGQACWTILGEGNTSGRIDQEVFAVKSSGSSLATLTEIELTHCYFDRLLPVLDRESVSESEIEEILPRLSRSKHCIEAVCGNVLSRLFTDDLWGQLCRPHAPGACQSDPLFRCRYLVRGRKAFPG